MLRIMWLVLTNQNALFHIREAMLFWNLLMTLTPELTHLLYLALPNESCARLNVPQSNTSSHWQVNRKTLMPFSQCRKHSPMVYHHTQSTYLAGMTRVVNYSVAHRPKLACFNNAWINFLFIKLSDLIAGPPSVHCRRWCPRLHRKLANQTFSNDDCKTGSFIGTGHRGLHSFCT